MNNSDTVYEYKKIKPLGDNDDYTQTRILKNKINELLIEQNQMAKDFELYKRAYRNLVLSCDVLEVRITQLENRIK